MMGHREPLKSGDEFDALTRARRFHRWRGAALRRIKRAFSKRVRREADDDIHDYRRDPINYPF